MIVDWTSVDTGDGTAKEKAFGALLSVLPKQVSLREADSSHAHTNPPWLLKFYATPCRSCLGWCPNPINGSVIAGWSCLAVRIVNSWPWYLYFWLMNFLLTAFEAVLEKSSETLCRLHAMTDVRQQECKWTNYQSAYRSVFLFRKKFKRDFWHFQHLVFSKKAIHRLTVFNFDHWSNFDYDIHRISIIWVIARQGEALQCGCFKNLVETCS